MNKGNKRSILTEQAMRLFDINRSGATKDGKDYVFHRPSAKLYPFQWFWDSCFQAIVLSKIGEVAMAEKELAGLFAWQRTDGFIPHVIFWDKSKVPRWPWTWHNLESKPLFAKPDTTELIQPPVLAQAIEKVWHSGGKRGVIEEYTEGALRYYRWLISDRDPDKDGLVSIISTFESGLDWSPQFDSVLLSARPTTFLLRLRSRIPQAVNKYIFRYKTSTLAKIGPIAIEEVLVNVVLAQGLLSLSRLLNEFGADSESEWARESGRKVAQALINKCYSEPKSAFFALNRKEDKPLRVLTFASLMPIILQDTPGPIVKDIVSKHLLNKEEFWLPFPVPSVSASEKSFFINRSLPSGYEWFGWSTWINAWRGPTWININWFLFHGLRLHGYQDLALELAQKTQELVLKSGFREYYNPFTGQGMGAENFGWSTLVLDMI